MMFLDFNAGEKTYQLRLSTRAIVSLEKMIGCNPIAIFGNGDTVPPVTTMVQILHASLQQYNHGITLDDAYSIFDTWLADGHTITDFIAVIIEIYKVSGVIRSDSNTGTEKN